MERAQERTRVGDHLVEHHGQRRALPHVEALLERRAGLLEEDAVEAVEQARRDDGVLQTPAAVGVGDHNVLVRRRSEYGPHTRGVVARVGPEFQLEVVDPLGPTRFDVRRHLLRRAERHGDVERVRLLAPAAEQYADGLAGRFPEHVPARDVDRALRVRVTEQRCVEAVVDDCRLAWVHTEQHGTELAQGSTRAFAVRWQVRRPERARFPESFRPVVSRDAHDGAWKALDLTTTRHDVRPVDVRQVVAVDVDPRDVHVRRGR